MDTGRSREGSLQVQRIFRWIPHLRSATFVVALTLPTVRTASAQCIGTWSQPGGAGPAARTLHKIAYDADRGRAVLFGGSAGGGFQGDTWEYDGSTWQLRANSGPSPRFAHAMCYDPVRHRVVLFGGFDVGWRRDTWEWDGNDWTYRSNAGPSPRMFSVMTFDPTRQRTLLFGGYAGGNLNGETWEWDGVAWSQLPVTGPSPRYNQAMSSDTIRSRVVLFGGVIGSNAVGADTWEWNGTSWNSVCTAGPAGRYGAGVAFDPVRATTIMYGGYSNTYLGDMWEWAGAGWIPFAGPTPGSRRLAGACYMQNTSRVLIFGGENAGGNLGDTWTYLAATPPHILAQPASPPIPFGSPASFSVTPSGLGPFTYQWRRNGVNLLNGGRFSGVLTPSLTISSVGLSEIAAYDCVVTNPCGSTRSDPTAPAISSCGFIGGVGESTPPASSP